MKNIKKYLRPIALLLLSLLVSALLVSCDFFAWEEGESPEAADGRIALTQKKTDYIELLWGITDEEVFNEAEKRIFRLSLVEAVNEINECESIGELDAVYQKHALLIGSIKTAADYDQEETERYREEKIAEISQYVKLSDYRTAEAEKLQALIDSYTNAILSSPDRETVAGNVRAFIAEVSQIKTARTLYEEELNALREEVRAETDSSVNLTKYRPNEVAILQATLAAFHEQLDRCTTKEAVTEAADTCKRLLSAVKTDKALYEEERQQLVNTCYEELLQLSVPAELNGEDKERHERHCEEIKAEMLLLQTKEAVLQKQSDELRAFWDERARSNEPLALNYYREALICGAKNHLTLSLYREEQKSEISACLLSFVSESYATTDYDAINEIYRTVIATLEAIPTNARLWSEDDAAFREKLRELYGDGILQEPKSLTEASNYYELADIIDYYAFYQISNDAFVRDTFRVHLNYAHNTAQYEINEVYWYCELLRSGAGITGELEDEDYLVLRLIPYSLGTNSNRDTTEPIERYDSLVTYDSDKSSFIKRTEDFDAFPYLQYEKEIPGIWNTQQLWYALEHGYRPVCVPGSVAERTLNRAKEVLREIICEGMSEEEKIFCIYSWFAVNVQYDVKYNHYLGSSDLDRFPDEQAATLDSFMAEGAILNHLAVCEGYAKAYLILLRMEGIESYRVFVRHPILKGKNSINPNLGGYGSHAFVAIRAQDGKFYYSDTEQSFVSGKDRLQTYHQIMVAPSLFTGYWGGFTYMYPDMEFGTGIGDIYRHLTYQGESVFISEEGQITALAEMLLAMPESLVFQVSVFCDNALYAQLKNTLESLTALNIETRTVTRGSYSFREMILYR